jgi:hypothetical protein
LRHGILVAGDELFVQVVFTLRHRRSGAGHEHSVAGGGCGLDGGGGGGGCVPLRKSWRWRISVEFTMVDAGGGGRGAAGGCSGVDNSGGGVVAAVNILSWKSMQPATEQLGHTQCDGYEVISISTASALWEYLPDVHMTESWHACVVHIYIAHKYCMRVKVLGVTGVAGGGGGGGAVGGGSGSGSVDNSGGGVGGDGAVWGIDAGAFS